MEFTATPKAELLAPGTRIGRYYLLHRLAIGGMAELHLACAEGVAGFQKVVVLKHVLPHLAADPNFVQMFLNEARLAATLDHPNIVQVTDIGESEGDYFYVMEYVHGRNARELLRAATTMDGLPLEVALAITIGAASALNHAHAATDLSGEALGLVHRDVSPANLLVSYDGAVKLADFGIAKAAARSTETIGGAVKGKIGYMSPEQCRGERVDQRSDLFALGVVLFELTTCERLFYADNDFAVLNQVITGNVDRPSDRVPDYPKRLEEIVLKALANDPRERYATADEVRRDLETFVHEEHLRCTPATVADWMKLAFGKPDYPKVELVAVAEPDAPRVPTLITGNDEAPTTIHDAAIAEVKPPATRRWPLVLGALMIAGGIAAGTLVALRDPVSSPGPTVAQPADANPVEASAGTNEPAPARASNPATDEPQTPVAAPAVDLPAPIPEPPTGKAPRRSKRSKRKKKGGKKPSAPLDSKSLYPVPR